VEEGVKDYTGRLLRYRPIIAAMILAGQSSHHIGRLLCALGARSDWNHLGVDNLSSTTALVRVLKKKWEAAPVQRAPVIGTWTPEDVWRETEGLGRKI
jgi:hypothetical protein